MRQVIASIIIAVFASSTLVAQTGVTRLAAIDINNIKYIVPNDGRGGYDISTNGPGIEYPAGSTKYLGMLDGFLFKGVVDGDTRIGGASYRSGLQPGIVLANGTAADPSDTVFHIYKITRLNSAGYAQLPDEEQNNLRVHFTKWPVQHGARFLDRNGNGNYEPNFTAWLADSTSSDCPLFEGDQVIWFVANDLDSRKTNFLYGSNPMGLEWHIEFWAFNVQGILGKTIFMRYTGINKSSKLLRDCSFAKMTDLDLGYFDDDYTGIDTTLDLGYVYNGSSPDQIYGAAPPAAGHVLLQGPMVASPGHTASHLNQYRTGYRNLGITGFNGTPELLTFPNINWWDQLHIDPYKVVGSRFMYPGDPVAHDGWTDERGNAPGDRKYLMSSESFDMNPGDTVDVVYAFIVADGADRLDAVTQLRNAAQYLRATMRYTITTAGATPATIAEHPALSPVYPNPVAQGAVAFVSFEGAFHGSLHAALYDMLGRNVQTLYNGNTQEYITRIAIDTQQLRPGNYSIIAKSGTMQRIQPLVVLPR